MVDTRPTGRREQSRSTEDDLGEHQMTAARQNRRSGGIIALTSGRKDTAAG